MKRGEKGFTVIELLIGVAIMGVIAVPLMMATTTLLTNPQRSTDQNAVLHEVRNAGYWISRDVQMARVVTLDAPNRFLQLSIPVDGNEDNDYSAIYLFDGNKLKRQVYDSLGALISETLIAGYIDTDNTIFSDLGSGSYKLTVRAAKGDAGVTRSYEINQRVSPAD
ncbi:hypothetical protein ES703_98998 [subsurface metagenome]